MAQMYAHIDLESRGRHHTMEMPIVETLHEVRAFATNYPDLCELTMYHFELEKGKGKLSEYRPLSEMPEFEKALATEQKVIKLRIVEDFYDERAARLHVRRLREVLVHPPAFVTNVPVLHAKEKKEKKKASTAAKQNSDEKKFTLEQYYDEEFFLTQKMKKPVLECVSNIRFSAYNPVPGFRRVLGDLLYLEVTTLENNILHVTSGVDGFYLNASTHAKFDASPAEASYKSHTLAALLKRASPLFKERFKQLVHRKVTNHPLEIFPNPMSLQREWCKFPEPHAYDWNRAEDSLVDTYGMDDRGVTRDWNEEFQIYTNVTATGQEEAPAPETKQAADDGFENDNIDPSVLERHRVLTYNEFVQAATKGAIAIVQGNIPAINLYESERQHVYLYNKIFFTYAVDGRDVFGAHGDEIAHKNAGHDLHGVDRFSQIARAIAADSGQGNAKELINPALVCTVATVVINFAGHRIVAQSIPAGMIQTDSSELMYGALELTSDPKTPGSVVVSDESFHTLIKPAAKYLSVREHKITNPVEGGKDADMCFALESKGFKCVDGRKYVLDLYRLNPRDANFPDPETNSTALLRPELVQRYIAMLRVKANRESVNAYNEKLLKARAAANNDSKELSPEEAKERNALAAAAELEATSKVQFNLDLLSRYENRLADSEEQLAKDKKVIVEASNYLTNTILPSFVENLSLLKHVAEDSDSLTSLMHEYGINMRYLGSLHKLAGEKKLAYVQTLALLDMLVRSAKDDLSQQMREVRPTRAMKQDHWFLAPCIAKYLSSFLGASCGGQQFSEDDLKKADLVLDRAVALRQAAKAKDVNRSINQKKKRPTTDGAQIKLENGRTAPTDLLAPVNVWQSLRRNCKKKFNFDIPASLDLDAEQRIMMLRSLCKKLGLQIQCRDFAFAEETPFQAQDVLDIYPTTKQLTMRCEQGGNLLENAIFYQNTTGSIAEVLHMFEMAADLITSCFGSPLNKKSAICYRHIALWYKANGRLDQAVQHMQRALIIHQRVDGLDHVETGRAHSLLALFLHQNGMSETALKHLHRALFIFQLIGGLSNPATAAIHSNLAIVYSELQDRRHLYHAQMALACTKAALGSNHATVAYHEHRLATSHALLGGYKDAILHEQQAKKLNTALYGAEHNQVKMCVWYINKFAEFAKAVAQTGDLSLIARLPQALGANDVSVWRISNINMPKQSTGFKLSDLLTYIAKRQQAEAQNQANDAKSETKTVEVKASEKE